MTALKLDTPSLHLVLESTEAILARFDAMPESDRAEVSPEWIARVRNAPAPSPWTHGFAMVEKTTGSDVGSCAFKGPPDVAGIVEIAYGVHEPYRGRGYAKESANALVRFAFDQEGISVVHAHTRPDNPASQRVLVAAGFAHLGEVTDPEDGLVWRWAVKRPSP